LSWEKLARAARRAALHPTPPPHEDQNIQLERNHLPPHAPSQAESMLQRQGGLMRNIDRILQRDPLVQLVQKDNFVGWVYDIDYGTARVMTNDQWKANVLGVPHNAFLV